jgi:CRP/FNR family cyclic AMP-dependent transcriptional regulator
MPSARKTAAIDARATAMLARPGDPPGEWETLLAGHLRGKTTLACGAGDHVFMQGQLADAVYFILRGKVTLTVSSADGKEAIVSTLGPDEFFGEGCLAGQPLRMATALAAGDSLLIRIEKPLMRRMLREDPVLAEAFIDHLLTRVIRFEADFIDQMFNSAEKRLARMLLLLSHFGEGSTTETLVAGVNQEHLAQMVGTTRSRINFFMNRFRKLGFINYGGETGLAVHRSLLSVVGDE